MDKSTNKLLNGTIIYFIGNAIANILSLVLLRFITGNISTEDYGIYNLVVTITNLVTPLITLQIADALFKFFLRAENEVQRKSVFTISLIVTIAGIVVTFAGVFVIDALFLDIPHPALVALYMVLSNLYLFYQRITRSLGKNKIYVWCNLLKTALFLILQIVFIYAFNLKLEALFLAFIISTLIFVVLSELFIKSYKLISFKTVDSKTVKDMLKFSVPLIPNAAFWWLTSSINALIVSMSLGLDVNGIYSVSNKFSSILALVTNVFIMSWQESAISEYGSDNFKGFFTKTFNMYGVLIGSALATLIPFIKLIFPLVVDPSYGEASNYAPMLLVATGFSTVSGFFAQIFSAQGKTYKNLVTTMAGTFLNIFTVFLLIGKFGLWAAVLGTFVADAGILMVRFLMVRKELVRGIAFVKMGVLILMLCASVAIYFYGNTIWALVWFIITAAVSVVFNRGLLNDILKIILEKLHLKKVKNE